MEKLILFLEDVGKFLSLMRIADLVDILIVILVVYKLLTLVKSTRAENVLKGIAVFLVVLGLSTMLEMHTVSYILSQVMELGILALIVLFQPEIRQILERLGSKGTFSFMKVFQQQKDTPDEMQSAINEVVELCGEMSKTKTGVLLVFEREISLDEPLRSGTTYDAQVNCELLKNIFFINAPMHDGATIVRRGRIVGSGCMLPLSKNVNLSRDLGMRHRAGIGMSENSDAVAVIVSEETGSISVAVGGMLKRHLKPETLGKLLYNELMPHEEEPEEDKPRQLVGIIFEKLFKREKEDGYGQDE